MTTSLKPHRVRLPRPHLPASRPASLTCPPPASDVATALLGPPYVGYMLQFVLFGMATSNFVNYLPSRNYKNDSRYNRI